VSAGRGVARLKLEWRRRARRRPGARARPRRRRLVRELGGGGGAGDLVRELGGGGAGDLVRELGQAGAWCASSARPAPGARARPRGPRRLGALGAGSVASPAARQLTF
jgi:hypothetical protein